MPCSRAATAASTRWRWLVSRSPRARSCAASGGAFSGPDTVPSLDRRYGRGVPVTAPTARRRVAIWTDGGPRTVDPDAPVVTAFDQGLGRGDGAFESVLVTGGKTPHLAAHPLRLAPPARIMSLPDPGDGAVRALVAALVADWPADVDGACRVLLTRG